MPFVILTFLWIKHRFLRLLDHCLCVENPKAGLTCRGRLLCPPICGSSTCGHRFHPRQPLSVLVASVSLQTCVTQIKAGRNSGTDSMWHASWCLAHCKYSGAYFCIFCIYYSIYFVYISSTGPLRLKTLPVYQKHQHHLTAWENLSPYPRSIETEFAFLTRSPGNVWAH